VDWKVAANCFGRNGGKFKKCMLSMKCINKNKNNFGLIKGKICFRSIGLP